jgi:hypothetical protein
LEESCWPETRLYRDKRAETAIKWREILGREKRAGKESGKEDGSLPCFLGMHTAKRSFAVCLNPTHDEDMRGNIWWARERRSRRDVI